MVNIGGNQRVSASPHVNSRNPIKIIGSFKSPLPVQTSKPRSKLREEPAKKVESFKPRRQQGAPSRASKLKTTKPVPKQT
jgi:hypothetical protein